MSRFVAWVVSNTGLLLGSHHASKQENTLVYTQRECKMTRVVEMLMSNETCAVCRIIQPLNVILATRLVSFQGWKTGHVVFLRRTNEEDSEVRVKAPEKKLKSRP